MENQTADTSHDVQSATASLLGLLPDEDTSEAGESQDAEEASTDAVDEDASDEVDESDEAESEAEDDADDESSDDEEEVARETESAEDKAARLRHADYTRKTQALAEQRRKLEADAEAVRKEREEYGARLQQLADALKSQEPDWDALRKEDPAKYAAAKLDWQEKQQALAEEQAKLYERQLADMQKQRESLLEQEQTRLLEAIPEWSEPETAKSEKTRLVSYAQSMGYTPDDLASVVDHRAVVMLRKAMLYDEMTTKGKEVVREKAKKPPATLKPGTPTPKRKRNAAEDALKRFTRHGGSSNDAARLLEQFDLD